MAKVVGLLAIEDGQVELDPTDDFGSPVVEVAAEIEFGRAGMDFDPTGNDALSEAGDGIQTASWQTTWTSALRSPLEADRASATMRSYGYLLVGEGIEGDGAHVCNELVEGGVAVEVHPQRQDVGEHPDGVCRSRSLPVGSRGADDEVTGAGESRQGCREASQNDYERCSPAPSRANCRNASALLGVDGELGDITPGCARGSASAVERSR